MKKPKMILFDYGQTLANEARFDGVRGTSEVLKHAARNKYGLSAEQVQARADELNRELGRFDPANRHKFQIEAPNHMFTAYLYESLGIELSLTAEQIDRIFWDAAAPGVPTDGIEGFLEFLYQCGIRTGVISNISYAGSVVEGRINELLPNHHFEFIIATSEYMYRKPNRKIFELALEKAELGAEEVWYVGDSYECDVVGARNAGLFPVHYIGAMETAYEQRDDVTVIKSWTELEEFIKNQTDQAFDPL